MGRRKKFYRAVVKKNMKIWKFDFYYLHLSANTNLFFKKHNSKMEQQNLNNMKKSRLKGLSQIAIDNQLLPNYCNNTINMEVIYTP